MSPEGDKLLSAAERLHEGSLAIGHDESVGLHLGQGGIGVIAQQNFGRAADTLKRRSAEVLERERPDLFGENGVEHVDV